jgi:hypothetical protein
MCVRRGGWGLGLRTRWVRCRHALFSLTVVGGDAAISLLCLSRDCVCASVWVGGVGAAAGGVGMGVADVALGLGAALLLVLYVAGLPRLVCVTRAPA